MANQSQHRGQGQQRREEDRTGQATAQMTSRDLDAGMTARVQGIKYEMQNIPFTQEGLQNFLGPNWHVKPSRQGNFQVNIANMRSMSDDDKITMLYKGREALRTKGFAVNGKLTFRSSVTGDFQNWPCLWVDQGDTRKINHIMGLKSQISELRALINTVKETGDTGLLDEWTLEREMNTGGGDVFEGDREIMPSEEDFEAAARVERHKQQISQGIGLRNTIDPTERQRQLNSDSPGFGGYPEQHYGEIKEGRSPNPQRGPSQRSPQRDPLDED